MTRTEIIVLGLLGAGAVIFGAGALKSRSRGAQNWQIDPDLGKHRGLGYVPLNDQVPTRMASAQDPRGGAADYLGYPYGATQPSVYAKGEPAQHLGHWYDKREDDWNVVPPAPLDYGAPPVRVPRLWKDAIRYWDGLTSHGGTDVVGQRVHLFHLRPSAPTRGYRSVSGILSPIGGGESTASRVRIPAIFVPSNVA